MEGFDSIENMKIAVKLFHKKEGDNQTQKAQQIAEANMLSSFDHPNIIKLLHTLDCPEFGMCLMFPLMQRSLFDEIYNIDYQYKPNRCKEVLYMIFSGLQYMHNLNVVHRDIKPENILVEHDGTVMIADFGLPSNTSNHLTTVCGTANFIAPEVWLMTGYDTKVDISVI